MKKTRSRFTFTAGMAAVALFLSGCTAIAPMEYAPKAVAHPNAAKNLAEGLEGWNDTPVVTEGTASAVLLTPSAPPASVRNRKVDIELEPAATVADLVAILGRLGIPTIVADTTVANRSFYLPKYSGALGGLLSAVTRATDTWFVWHEGTLVVSATEKIGVAIPQESDFAAELTKGLDGLGLTAAGGGAAVSHQAGMVSLEVTPKQFSKVRTYLERMTSNAAMVTMQMVIIDVGLDQSAKKGVDWEKLSVSMQPQGTSRDLTAWRTLRSDEFIKQTGSATVSNATSAASAATAPAASTAVTTTATDAATTSATEAATSATTAAVSTTATSNAGLTTGTINAATTAANSAALAAADVGAALPAAVTLLQLASGNVGAAIFMDRFSFEGLFGFLQTYGTVDTRQNVILKTVAGNKVTMQSVTKVPYISSVSATTSGTASTNVTGSSTTAQAEDGIKVDLTPSYDAAGNSVTVAVDLSLKAVLQFNELSAGNQLGTLTQPTTADRSFNDKVRLRPGQTAVIGGLTYDTVTDKRGAPLYMQRTPLESQNLLVKRTSTFIVLRPTVTRLGRVQAQDAAQGLDLLPSAEDAPAAAPKSRKSAGAAK